MSKIAVIILVAASVLVFLVYFFTSAPSLGLIDSGELTAVAYTLGIAHPTGYPLYTITAHLFSLFPFNSVARGIVIFGVFCTAAACAILLWAAARMLRVHTKLLPIPAALCACAGVLPFAFSLTAWQTAAYAEVYPLTLLLVSLIYAMGLRLLAQDGCDTRTWLAYGFVFGLALGNHLTVLWTFPLGVVAFLTCFRGRKQALPAFLALFGAVILGASVILYLPVRSHLHPVLNWGDPETLTRLWRHLTAWQYQVWMFQKGIVGRLADYFAGLPAEFGWGGLALVVLGVFGLAKRAARVLIAFALVWLMGILYNVNYDIPDIAPYFLPAHAALSLIAAGGAAFLWQAIKPRTAGARALTGLLLAIPVVWSAAAHFKAANRSNDYFAYSLAHEILRTLPLDALVFQSIWDVQSPVLYLQDVEGYRSDVVLVDINLMRRSWYVEQLSERHPEIVEGCQRERDNFLRKVEPFEAGRPYDSGTIERAFVAFHDSLISKNLAKRPVYLRFAREAGHSQIGAHFEATPGAFFFHLGSSNGIEDLLDVEKILGTRKDFNDREKSLLSRIYEILTLRQQNQQTTIRSDSVEKELELLKHIVK
jgi:hypothetical protein